METAENKEQEDGSLRQVPSTKVRLGGFFCLMLILGVCLTLLSDGFRSFVDFAGVSIVFFLGLTIPSLIIVTVAYLIFLVFGKKLKLNTIFLILASFSLFNFILLLYGTLRVIGVLP